MTAPAADAAAEARARRADDARWAAVLLALDPIGLGGAWVRARPGPALDAWRAELDRVSPDVAARRRKIPIHAGLEQLFGGLDLAATLSAGRPVAAKGLLAAAAGGLVSVPSVERRERSMIAALASALEPGGDAPRFGVLAIDETEPDARDGPAPAGPLADRLALEIDLDGLRAADVQPLDEEAQTPEALAAARARLPAVSVPDDVLAALTTTAAALGVWSLRAPTLAARVASALAALREAEVVDGEDAALAARLVLAPRATRIPAPPEPQEPEEAEDEDDAPPPEGREETPDSPPQSEQDTAPDPDENRQDENRPEISQAEIDEMVLAAAAAALPSGLLSAIDPGAASGGARVGAAGGTVSSRRRGRPAGVRRGDPRSGDRLDLVETLRTAAPWGPLRRRAKGATAPHLAERRVIVTTDDLRVKRFKRPSETVAIFLVDASGSAAFQRLAEAKGAVELLLGDSYARRDHAALIAFRGEGAELLLAPTRSLTRVKKALAQLPGGGGTPLAAGLDAARDLAEQSRRRGLSPILIVLTDGRANIGRDGRPGRERAAADARDAAGLIAAQGIAALLIDAAPRPQAKAKEIAEAMAARYLPLPFAGAEAVSAAARVAREAARSKAGAQAASA